MKHWVIIAALSALTALTGCGYSARSTLPSQYRTIAVVPFANKIDFSSASTTLYVPLLEVKAHDAVVKQFLFNGRLRIASETAADMVMVGELIGYDRGALRYTDNDDVQEYRITVTVKLSMKDSAGQTLWEEPSFSGEATYFLSGPRASSEAAAIEEAVKDLARRIVERTVEDW